MGKREKFYFSFLPLTLNLYLYLLTYKDADIDDNLESLSKISGNDISFFLRPHPSSFILQFTPATFFRLPFRE